MANYGPATLRIDVARDGEDALRFLANSRPDLILLDLNLPRVHGLQILKQVKEDRGCQAAIIVMSSSQNPKDIDEALKNGAVGYIVKGTTLEKNASRKYDAPLNPG